MNNDPTRVLKHHHLEDLEKSGISEEIAYACGLRSLDISETSKVLNREMDTGSLAFLFYNPYTKELIKINDGLDFVRVRLNYPERASTRNGKPPKYLSIEGSGQQPYVPPIIADQIVAGDLEALFLTEGEKKAICGCVHGFPTVGLTGNWGWKVGKKVSKTPQLLPLLDRIIRPGMHIIIVWDSDAVLNSAFAASTRMLHDQLRKKGCPTSVLVLPQIMRKKVGLDDFLVKEGREAFKELF